MTRTIGALLLSASVIGYMLLALVGCVPVAPASGAPATTPRPAQAGDPAALANAAQATADAARLSATQQAGATLQAYQATQQAWAERQAQETQRVQRATQQAQSDQATSTANVRATWDAATSTAGAMALQSTALAGTQAALIAQATSQTALLAQRQEAFDADQQRALDNALLMTRVTAEVQREAEVARVRTMKNNLVYGGSSTCLGSFATLAILWTVAYLLRLRHKQVVEILHLQAATALAGQLPASTITGNDGGKIPINNWTDARQSTPTQQPARQERTLKDDALMIVDKSAEVLTNGVHGNRVLGHRQIDFGNGTSGERWSRIISSLGSWIVVTKSGTYVRAGRNLGDLQSHIEGLSDDLSPPPPGNAP